MTSEETQVNAAMKIVEALRDEGLKDFTSIVSKLFDLAMEIEREKVLEAAPYERTKERTGYANGYKEKALQTRYGKLELRIPQTRDVEFYPSCLEKGAKSERALRLAIAEMYVTILPPINLDTNLRYAGLLKKAVKRGLADDKDNEKTLDSKA